MQRPTVLLLFGGESSEHDVSISSARNVYAAIDDTKYDVILGYIDRTGKWWLLEGLDGTISTHGQSQIIPVLGSQSFVTLPAGKVMKPTVILPILHGKNGEDGTVQGLAQLLHIPIAGSGMTASALCMDKVAAKKIASANDIRIVPYEVYKKNEQLPDFGRLSMQLGSPLFVKPVNAGSSFGVSKVYSEDELARAVETALQYDDVVLIEAGIIGRELEVAVLGNPPHHKATVAAEVNPHGEFYDYKTKYDSDSELEVTIPAAISDTTARALHDMALKAYEALGCKGLARVDFFLEGETLYLNEINTFPGFTNTSIYPKLWRHEGISYSQLIDRLLALALESTVTVRED